MIRCQNFQNLTPCGHLLMWSDVILSVGQHSMLMFPLLIWSMMQKQQMLIAYICFPELALPFFANKIALSLSCLTMFSHASCPCSFKNNGTQSANGSTWSTPTNSATVELSVFSFCFADALITDPCPFLNLIVPPT